MGYSENGEAGGKIWTWGRFNRGSDAQCVIKRGITAEVVPIPMGLQQVVVLHTRQVPSMFLYNIRIISFGFCSSHFETNNRNLTLSFLGLYSGDAIWCKQKTSR